MHHLIGALLRMVPAVGLLLVVVVVPAYAAPTGQMVSTTPSHAHIDCRSSFNCTEVHDAEAVFGNDQYVGHDEPSVLFYSSHPGSGNAMVYQLTLPTDPSSSNPSAKSFNFQLHPAFWFGMAMCDTQSYPEQLSTCTPDSDANIVDPAVSPQHPGAAFTELQFYPPGWVSWPAGNSCDAIKWCAALNIDSLLEDPVTGQTQNATCLAQVGVEPVNFAFITRNGVPQAPPNPVDATTATFTPDPNKDLFMSSGDHLVVTLLDSPQGLVTIIVDVTSRQYGFMIASASNGFGQVQFDPTGTSCTNIPYDFHSMYSTSSEQTRVPWAAHSYNIAFADETGHFDACSAVTSTGGCSGTEGNGTDVEPSDADDVGCFPASASTLVQIAGCLGTNSGFDGTPYHRVWPDGNTSLHPSPIRFSSPLSYGREYERMAFEADLPRIESTCNRLTGAGCTLIPTTDDGVPAEFYPFFSTAGGEDRCTWLLGNDVPGVTRNDFGKNSQYGTLLSLTYTGIGGTPIQRINDFRQVLSTNPCPAVR